MKKTIGHIAIYLLTASVLFASTGVSVHQFYCYCMGQMTASIFKPGDPCDEEATANCCKLKLDDDGAKGETEGDCSGCTSKYVHLDADYLLISAEFELLVADFLPLAKLLTAQETPSEHLIPVWENDLPPPPHGKSLLPHIQSFLC